jgi:hypothetical protein
MESDRRSALLALKLKALVRDHRFHEMTNEPTQPSSPFGGGAGFVIDTTAWILLDQRPERCLGGAMAWAFKQSGVTNIAIIAESGSGVLARRAELFDAKITVWAAVDRVLVPAIAEPYLDQPELKPEHEQFRTTIELCGAEPCVEYGVLTGEVRGLEVCRVVDDPYTNETRLEVGVGAHDRDAYLTMHANRPVEEALRGVVDAVLKQRQPGAPLHPLNTLASERFLRWQILNNPAIAGAAHIEPTIGPVPRPNVKDHYPCVAIGETIDGQPLITVCSTGVDLDLVPAAADARAMHLPNALLRLVMPRRDVLPVTKTLAERVINGPCEIICP